MQRLTREEIHRDGRDCARAEFYRCGVGGDVLRIGNADISTGPESRRLERIEQALFQGGCTNSITLLPEGSGVKTGVQFRNGNVYAPMAFTGSYNLAGCMQFKGWAQSSIKLSFDQEKQTFLDT